MLTNLCRGQKGEQKDRGTTARQASPVTQSKTSCYGVLASVPYLATDFCVRAWLVHVGSLDSCTTLSIPGKWTILPLCYLQY